MIHCGGFSALFMNYLYLGLVFSMLILLNLSRYFKQYSSGLTHSTLNITFVCVHLPSLLNFVVLFLNSFNITGVCV